MIPASTEYSSLTGADMTDLLARREVSSTELVEAALETAELYDKRLGLFITRLDDAARRWAAEADRLRAAGDPRPLLGVPFAVKDLHPTAGVPLTMGSAAFAPVVPTADSGTIGLLRGAGLMPIGTTNTCELGPTCFTRSASAGDARNPWDESASASGSSGGSAAAVSARVLPWAHASDGAGSIRLPASVCGLVGHKPSRGATPPPASSYLALGVEGIVARTVHDARTLFAVMAQPAFDSLYPPPPAARANGVLNVGLCTTRGDGGPVDAECVAAARQVAAMLAAMGHQVVEVPNPIGEGDQATLAASLLDVMCVGAAAATAGLPGGREHLLQDYTRWLADRGKGIDGVRLHLAQTALAGVAVRALGAQRELDLLVSPTVTRPQIGINELDLDGADASYAAMMGWAAFTPMANCTGQPAISLPVGTTSEGLPIGVQLQGRVGSDHLLLDVAEQISLAAPWSERTPAMLQLATAEISV